MGIKPRRFRMLRLGRSASSVTVFPLLPTPLPPCLHSDEPEKLGKTTQLTSGGYKLSIGGENL